MPNFSIAYQIFDSPATLAQEDQELLERAKEALALSYSPYSNFRVGAAARLTDGQTVKAANTENAAYPMCICAEPNVMAAARALAPEERVAALAITVQSGGAPVTMPATPCGSCRQILAEYEGRTGEGIRLILMGESGEVWIFERASDLLPFGFSGDLL